MACFRTCYTECMNRIGFRDVNSLHFVLSQWRLPPILYIIYRLCLPLYTNICFIRKIGSWQMDSDANDSAQNITGGGHNHSIHPWWAYFTYWTYLMLCIYMTWHFVFTLVHLCIQPLPLNLFNCPDEELHRRLLRPVNGVHHIRHVCWYFKISWVLFSVATVGSLLVSVNFFVLLWPSYNQSSQEMNCQFHVMNSVIVLFEFALTAIPLRFWHVTYVLLYGIAYFIFTASYYSAGNTTPIYSHVVDWSNPAQTIRCALSPILWLTLILHIISFGIYKGKIFLYEKVCSSRDTNEHEDENGEYNELLEYDC